MELISYIQACSATPHFATAKELIIQPQILGFNLTDLIARSEQQVRELARVLRFNAGAATITAGAEIQGNATSVAMNCAVEAANPQYLGDIHNHPYQTKLGAGTSIGPSSGDLEQWLPNPGAYHITCHFVSSGPKLFLLVVRDATAAAFNHTPEDFDVENFLNAKMQGFDGDLPDPTSAQLGIWLDQNFRGAKAQWQRDHDAMLIRQARRYRFEYYSGAFRGSLVSVKLLSNSVYDRAFGQSSNYKLKCSACNHSHGSTMSSAFGRWHSCRTCGRVYCDRCGKALRDVPGTITRERQCRAPCNGRTKLIS